MTHNRLNDDEIQAYLEQEKMKPEGAGMDVSPADEEPAAVQQYRKLFALLQKRPELPLAENFADRVLQRILAEPTASTSAGADRAPLVGAFAGLAATLGLVAFLTGTTRLAAFFQKVLPVQLLEVDVVSSLSRYMEGIHLDFRLAGLAIMFLIGISFVDRLFFNGQS